MHPLYVGPCSPAAAPLTSLSCTHCAAVVLLHICTTSAASAPPVQGIAVSDSLYSKVATSRALASLPLHIRIKTPPPLPVQGIAVSDSLYSKVVKELCTSRGAVWSLR